MLSTSNLRLRRQLPPLPPIQKHSPKPCNISFFYANVKSIVNKINDLHLPLHRNFDILAFSETWLKPFIFDSEILPPSDYTLFPTDRETLGGGVLPSIRSNLQPSCIEVPENLTKTPDGTTVECVFASFTTKARRIAVGCVYRPPACTLSYTQQLCTILEWLEPSFAQHDALLLMGDFNYHINWETHSTSKEDAQLFLNSTANLNLTQLVDFPTLDNQTLDLIFTNNTQFISSVIPI